MTIQILPRIVQRGSSSSTNERIVAMLPIEADAGRYSVRSDGWSKMQDAHQGQGTVTRNALDGGIRGARARVMNLIARPGNDAVN
jgi:hypothetical protein